jgi:hypothetical protein
MGEARIANRAAFGIVSEHFGSSHVPLFRLDGSRLVFDDPRLNRREPPPTKGTRRAGKDKGRNKRRR